MWELERVNLARSIAGLFLSSCRPSSETYARLPVTLARRRSLLGVARMDQMFSCPESFSRSGTVSATPVRSVIW